MIYIIYKIYCLDNQTNYTYIGHTKCFNTRKSAHKGDCCKNHKPNYNFPVYQTIRQYGSWTNWSMIPLEKLDCDLIEAKIREQYWIEQQQNKLNIKTAFITEQDANIKAAAASKIYHENHKKELKEKRKKYTAENKEKIAADYTAWYQANKEKRKIYNMEYRKTLTSEQKAKHNQSRKDKREKSNISMMDALVAIN